MSGDTDAVLRIFGAAFGIIPFFVNVSNIIFILRKEGLRIPMYYLLINIAVAETIFAISVVSAAIVLFVHSNIPIYKSDHIVEVRVLVTICVVTYRTSIYTSVLLSIDRFINIKYCLRYYQLVTKKILLAGVVLVWFIAVFASIIPAGKCVQFSQHGIANELNIYIVPWILTFISCLMIISASVYTRHIRRKHVREITRTAAHFGISAQKLTILRRLKQSVKDILRFNVITLAFVSLQTIFSILRFFVRSEENRFYKSAVVCIFLYMTSSPFIYAYNMTELKNEYRRLLGPWCICIRHRNAVGDSASITQSTRQVTSST